MTDNGVILERISGKKLAIIVTCLVLSQLAFFLFGCISFPNATHTESVEGIMCKARRADVRKKQSNADTIYYLRDYLGRSISNCDRVDVDENKNIVIGTHQSEIVYAFQIPLPRDNRVLRLHRLFQTMTCVLQMQVHFESTTSTTDGGADGEQSSPLVYEETQVEHLIPMDVVLASRNSGDLDDKWQMMAHGKPNKTFKCIKSHYSLDCDLVQLFELPSVHHEFYVINARLGESNMINSIKAAASSSSSSSSASKFTINELPEVRLVLTFIYQTGGFTKMWLLVKTLMTCLLLAIMSWFFHRVRQLDRQLNVIERWLTALAVSTLLLNVPVEWLTLRFDLKWMLLFVDVRQIVFYSHLFAFWIVFCCEHLASSHSQRAIASHWKYVVGMWVACACLLVFKLYERGVQMNDPFFNIWESKFQHLATSALMFACACGVVYFLVLFYLIMRVFINLNTKRTEFAAMNKLRRAFYQGIIYRFNFLILATLFCAAMTVAFFITSYVNDAQWDFGDGDDSHALNYTAGFLTGVYAMWNIYVASILIFFAPSHKNKENDNGGCGGGSDSVEFVNIETRLNKDGSELTALAQKIVSS